MKLDLILKDLHKNGNVEDKLIDLLQVLRPSTEHNYVQYIRTYGEACAQAALLRFGIRHEAIVKKSKARKKSINDLQRVVKEQKDKINQLVQTLEGF